MIFEQQGSEVFFDSINSNDILSEDIDQEDKEFFYYFAYGSNLLEERIRVQIKEANFDSVGVLPDYRLSFYGQSSFWKGGIASIEACAGLKVWGCVWKVPNSFAEELDRQERGYYRSNVNIFVPSLERTIMCRTYEYYDRSEENRFPPSPHYKHVIVSGAIEHELPLEYIVLLDQIESNGFKGIVSLSLKAIAHINIANMEDSNFIN